MTPNQPITYMRIRQACNCISITSMKQNIILALITIMLSLPTFAQTKKGDFMVGGSAYFGVPQPNKYQTFSGNIRPDIGLFVINNLALGVDMSVGFFKSTYSGNYTQHNQYLNIGPFARYYFDAGEKIKVIIETQLGYTWYKTRFYNIKDSNHSRYWGMGTGIGYFVTNNVAIEALINYYSDDLKDETNSNMTGQYSFDIGIQVHLNKSKEKKKNDIPTPINIQ